MSTTVKALIVGTTLALTGVTLLQNFAAAPVARLEPVVVSAKRVAVQPQVVTLDAVLVTATRADVMAAQLQEATKQANALLRKGS
ncbi:MAG: hypothetical protein RL341_1072 [Pseudomonadota bacterium]|jgi:hypothetical protein